ncbi:MAG: hypothetical protein K8R17_05785 [Methanosarcinales archaeon]|nr:hypothetical protein [Methanosarcinales archaeon]
MSESPWKSLNKNFSYLLLEIIQFHLLKLIVVAYISLYPQQSLFVKGAPGCSDVMSGFFRKKHGKSKIGCKHIGLYFRSLFK